MRIYADNAATTKMSKKAIETMMTAMERIYGNPSSLHSAGQEAAEVLQQARQQVAQCLGCAPAEIYFTSGGSEADNQALRTAAAWGAGQGKTHIISTAFEHHAVLHTLQALEKEGFTVTLLDVGEDGLVTAEAVRQALRPDTCLVSVMFVNNEVGTIQPIEEIGEVCRQFGVLFHTDAVQAVGHIPVHVGRQKVDMLSLSAHKFHGPKGVGALYVRRGIPVKNLIYGGGQERGKRAGTENIPAITAMAAALEEACACREETGNALRQLQDRLIAGLSAIPHSALNGHRTKRVPGNVSFCFEGIEGESLLLMLDDKGVCASSGSACTSGSLDPSHVLLALGRPHEVAHGSLRLSLCGENTMEEVEHMIAAVTDTVAYLRQISPVWRDLQTGKRAYIL